MGSNTSVATMANNKSLTFSTVEANNVLTNLTMILGDHMSNANFTSRVMPPFLYLRTRYALMMFIFVVLVASTAIGTLGNLLVILTIVLVRNLRTYGNMFILNLALADLVITTVVDPFNAVGAWAGELAYMGDNMLCNVVGSVCAPACMSSMWNMCIISLNRYVLICYPHLYRRIFTPASTLAMCLAIWVCCHLAHIPNHLGWGRIKFNTDLYLCTFDVIDTPSYAVFYVTMGVLVPLVGVLFGYARIFVKVRAVKVQMREHRLKLAIAAEPKGDNAVADGNTHRSRANTSATFTQEDVRLAKTLFMAFLVFFVCWLPFAMLVLLGQPAATPKWIYIAAMIMAHGNSAANPIIYGMSNEKFREGYRRITGCNLRVGSTNGSRATAHYRGESSNRHSHHRSFRTSSVTNRVVPAATAT